MNRVLLTGRLTRDPEMRVVSNGKNVTQFSIATNVAVSPVPRAMGPGEQARVRDRPRSAAMGPVELPGIRSPAERRSDYRRVPPSRSTVPVGVPSVLQSC